MPRIGGGGGGPIIPPQAQGAGETQKSDFAGQVQKAQAPQEATPAAKAQQAKATQQSQLTGKAREIAKRLKDGELSQKEATREFVALVIEERYPQFKKGGKKKKKKKGDGQDEEPQTPEEQLEEAVTELIDRDPAMAMRLSNQFKKLAAKG